MAIEPTRNAREERLMRLITLFLALTMLAACAAPMQPDAPRAAAPPTLEEAWRVTGLAAPESAALSADGAFLYVTNVNGEGDARDGNGFISRIGLDGRMIEREWAQGLDAPKGVARAGDRLYVSDIDRLVVLDAASGAVLERHAIAGAGFLNDVAVAPDGGVLITDSANARIYRFAGGRIETWLEQPLLDSVNGLLPEADRLIVTTMAGRLLAVDWMTRAVTQLAEGLGDGDGVAPLGAGAYLVSEWPGRLFVVGGDGALTTLLDTRAANAYMNDFLLVGDLLVIPNWQPGSVTAYRVRR